ncbi:putative quinol monooxygenase [Emticicia fontis]
MTYKKILLSILTLAMAHSYYTAVAQQKDMMVRIAEIEIYPDKLVEYKAILKEEAAASVKIEPGVLCIFPMSQKENPTQIRLLEIYASREAYEAHIKSPHFQHYKTSTLSMVKSLKLVEMNALDTETMKELFLKMK